MQHKQLSRVFQGTMILAISSLVAKILSAVYRIPFQNLVGNDGFYVYQQVYPLYGLGIVLALSGLPVFISKVIAEQETKQQQLAVAQQLFGLLLVAALIVTGVLWWLAFPIARLMGDGNLAPVIRSVSLMFLGMPFLAVGRGYHQGQYVTWPTSVTQLVEQVVRVSIVVCVAVLASQHHWQIYRTGTLAMASAPVAALCSSLIIMMTSRQLFRRPTVKVAFDGRLVKRLVVEGGAISLFAAMMILLQLVDSFTVKSALVSAGVPNGLAMSLKGVFDRGQPLIQLGLVVATSVSALLVPSLTESYQKMKLVEFRRQFQVLSHVCIAVSALCTTGLIAIMPSINELLFASRLGSFALAVNMLSIILAAVITMYSSVMQSLNRFSQIVTGLLIGLGVKAVTNYWLVMHFKIVGASLGTVLALLATLLVVWQGLPDLLHWHTKHWFAVKLTAICVMMGVIAGGTAQLVSWLIPMSRLGALLAVTVAVIVGVVIAGGLSVWWHLLSVKELLLLPHGKQFLIKLNDRMKSNETR